MFELITIEDKIIINPDYLKEADIDKVTLLNNNNTNNNNNKNNYNHTSNTDKISKLQSSNEIIKKKIREKYLNKVLNNKGLVIEIKSLKITNNTIVEIEGVISLQYETELIVYAPKKGELLKGTVSFCNSESIIVDCDIITVRVKASELPNISRFDETEKLWYWKFNNSYLYFDIGEKVVLKIDSVYYKSKSELVNLENQRVKDSNNNEVKYKLHEFIDVNGSFKQDGLGLIKWWDDYIKN